MRLTYSSITSCLAFLFLILSIRTRRRKARRFILSLLKLIAFSQYCLNSATLSPNISIVLVFEYKINMKTPKHSQYFRHGICPARKHGFYVPNLAFTIDKRYRRLLERVSILEGNQKRRDRLYIISEILTIAKNGSLKTQIMYRANLSFAQLNEYLSFLIKMDLLRIHNENNKNIYMTTAKGEKYLEKYEDLSYLLEASSRAA